MTFKEAHNSQAPILRILRLLIDGIFGPQTEGMTRACLASQGLAVDGVAGPATWAAASRQRGRAHSTAAEPSPVQRTFSAPASTHQALASSSSSGVAGGVWAQLRQRESGGNYSANTGNCFYGAYQFTAQTSAQVLATAEAEGASPSILVRLRTGLLCYSAALVAIGAVLALGVLPRPVAFHVATNRSADLAASRWAGQGLGTGSARPPPSRLRGRPPPGPHVPTAATRPPSTVPALVPPSAPPGPPAVYVNPLSRIADLQPGRIDQGVDYAGSGPLLALGSGTIGMTTEGGWPGGAFIALRLDTGQFVGRIVYYAENITPTVSLGQHVNPGDVVGILHDAFPHLEIGWGGGGAGGGTLGNALARSVGGSGEVATAQGVSFNQLLVSLGAPGA